MSPPYSHCHPKQNIHAVAVHGRTKAFRYAVRPSPEIACENMGAYISYTSKHWPDFTSEDTYQCLCDVSCVRRRRVKSRPDI